MKTSRRVHILQFNTSLSEHRSFLNAICNKTVAERSLVSSFEEALELIHDDPERDIIILDYALFRSERAYENDSRFNAGHVNIPTLNSCKAFTGASVPETTSKALAGSPNVDSKANGVHAIPFERPHKADLEIDQAQLLRTETKASLLSRGGRFREVTDLQHSLDQERNEFKDHGVPYNDTWTDDDLPNSMVKGWWIIPGLILGALFWFIVLKYLLLWLNQ